MTEGTFSVSAPQSTELVSHRVTEGKVSLTGTNVVSANMDLTPAGALVIQTASGARVEVLAGDVQHLRPG